MGAALKSRRFSATGLNDHSIAESIAKDLVAVENRRI